LNPDFINLVNSSTYGAKMPRASWDFIGNIFLPTPPIETQKLIATFLDSKTAAIDTLIDKKQRLIQLLEEKRTALINQSVTKGLNPNVSMKDSGIPWIGEIPEHWQICELRRKWEVIDCKHKTPEYIERGYPLVSTTEVKPRKIDLSIITRYISAKDFFDMTENRLPKKGDIIYSRNASLGSAAYVDTDELFAMGQDVVLITSKNQYQLFLSYYLNSKLGMSQVDLACVGSTFRRINVGQIRQIIITLPPINEQAEIGQYLEKATQFFSKNISIIGNQIEKLQEYRRSLITAAVTGKLNIKEVETNV
ncbi:MAG: restriction endonuclease subunit S, partial [Pseudanabaena sp.]